MSKYSDRIQNILKNADTKRSTDKKKCISELLDLYENKEAIREITKNTEEGASGIVNWSYMLQIVHKLLIHEAEKTVGKDMYNRTHTRNLILNTAREAAGRLPFVNCSEIVRPVLQVLDERRYVYYQETYLSILVNYILPNEKYQIQMLPDHWKKLLVVCINLYKNALPHVSRRNVLDALQTIVQHGCLRSNLLLDVKRILPFLENVLSDAVQQELVRESAYKLANTVCRQIATESRLVLCQFSENVTASIVSLSGTVEKYKLLLFFIQIHHPKGVHIDHDAAYAHNREKWGSLLESMYITILRDCKSNLLPKPLVDFASEVFKQILTEPNRPLDIQLPQDFCSQPAKRRRIATRLEKALDLISDCDPEEAWPMIQILKVLFERYPECIKPVDFEAFLRVLTSILMQSSQFEHIVDSVYGLARVLMQIEATTAKCENDLRFHNTKVHWDKMWDILLRSLSMNQNEVSACALVQSFIRYKRVACPNALLRLYVTKAVKWSPSSLQTLRTLCEHVPLPEESSTSNRFTSAFSTSDLSSAKLSCMEWALQVPWQKAAALHISMEDLCNVLVSTTVKSRYRSSKCGGVSERSADKHPHETTGFDSMELTISLEQMERCFFSLASEETTLFREKAIEAVTNEVEANTGTATAMVGNRKIVDVLVENLCRIVGADDAKGDNAHLTIRKAAFAGKMISILKEQSLFSEEDSHPMMQAIAECLKNCYTYLATMATSKRQYANLVNVAKALNVLYGTSYHRDVAKVIVSSSTVDAMKNIFDWLNIEDNSPRHNAAGNEGNLRVQAIKALTLFCRIQSDERKSEMQIKLMESLLNIDMYDLGAGVDFKMALIVLDSLLEYDKEEIYISYAEIPVKFLIRLFERSCKNPSCIRGILNVFPYMLEYAACHDCRPEDMLDVLRSFYGNFDVERCNPLIYIEMIKCVMRIAESEVCFERCSAWKSDTSRSSIVESILSYLNNPFYVVRLEAVRCIEKLFFSRFADSKWKGVFFDKLKESLANVFVIGRGLSQEEKVDEKQSRVATVLLSYGSIVRTGGTFQSDALYTILQLTVEKEIERRTVKKLLKTIAQRMARINLVEDNLEYLLSRWLSSERSLEEFPWELMECVSAEDFYKRHMNAIALTKIRLWKISDVLELCSCNNVPFARVFEAIFPEILAWLLSCVSETRENDRVESRYSRELFQEMISNAGDFSTTRKFFDLFTDHFERVIVNIVKSLHDERHFEEVFGLETTLPESSWSRHTANVVDNSLKYVEENFLSEKKSLSYTLASKCPSTLQKVLLTLASDVCAVKYGEHKLKAFHHYCYFCTMVIKEINYDYFDTMAKFIVRDISYTLLHVVNRENDTLAELACKFLKTFFKSILPGRAAETAEVLRFCVATLVPLVQERKCSVPSASEVLSYLIVEQQDILNDTIEKLDPFPDTPAFQRVNVVYKKLRYKNFRDSGLETEIQRFLEGASDKSVSCSSIEGLVHLRDELSKRWEELRSMYSGLEKLRGYAEDCALSVLHKLVYRLLTFTRSSDPRVAVEAAKCLGELGPADLSTMILHLSENRLMEATDPIETLTYGTMKKLIELLVDENIEIRKATADALYTILSYPWAQKLLNKRYLKALQAVLADSDETSFTDYVRPFIRKSTSKPSTVKYNMAGYETVVNPHNTVWSAKSKESYAEWIVEVTCSVIGCFSEFFLEALTPVCRLSIELCELILPRIVFLLIHVNRGTVKNVCSCINEFFDFHYELAREKDVAPLPPSLPLRDDSYDSRKAIRCMLNVVDFIRIHARDDTALHLKYIYIAKAAEHCAAYFTAILYAELACESLLERSRDFSNVPKIDYVCEERFEEGKILQSILRNARLKIGDPDAIYGCGSTHLQDEASRVQHYAYTRQWDKVILHTDNDVYNGKVTSTKGMVNALYQSGLRYLLGHFTSTMNDRGELDDSSFYESVWRLGNWDLCTRERIFESKGLKHGGDDAADYSKFHYEALKCFHENNEPGTRNAIENARKSIVKALRNVSLECSNTVYEKLTQLEMLREIEELSSAKFEECSVLLQKWESHDIGTLNEFQYVEPILTQRAVMYQTKNVLCGNDVVRDAAHRIYLEIARIAENQGYLPQAVCALGTLKNQVDLSRKVHDQLRYREGLLAWKRNDRHIARSVLRDLIQQPSLDPHLRAQVLRVYGNWMAEMKSENPQAIIRKYYEESIATSVSVGAGNRDPTSDVTKNLYDTHAALARFADAQYQQISNYMRSPQFESLKECVEYSCNVHLDPASKDADLRRAVIISQKQNTNDLAELESIHKERTDYLVLALRHYLLSLHKSEDYNLLIFRLIALWLDNVHHEEVNILLEEGLHKIPAFKFIPLVPQLAAHMSNVPDAFSTKIYEILKRCALEHPHHTLPVLLALKNLYADYDYRAEKRGIKWARKEEARVLGAKKLVADLTSSRINLIVQEMDILSRSLVMLANFEITTKEAGNSYKIPNGQDILKIRNFENILVPTLTIEPTATGNYRNVVGIFRYMDRFETVGGLNAPKRVICVGTDGISRKQLVKGKDDLRQDAVMQQVFNVMNILLQACKETKRRKLKIRTYKVVPLTQRSGILEWCDNTELIKNVLVGADNTSGIHKKYYPNDYTANICRKKMDAVSRATNETRLKVFMECCAHMRPAFHLFFHEKYPSSEAWYERTLAYTRSVATTSVAGYILGLGDRHLSNILIDQLTAEVIHIDFGVAFEQGKVLPIPETVPFRLTRDIEAAMGTSGIEGTMRRSCEEILTVLRDQRQIIITLVQVLLYDPLFTWAITPAKAYNLQSGDTRGDTSDVNQANSVTNKFAERALLRIEQKLQGTEEGIISSVSGQVERLLQEARDPSNLSRIFCGWQPYL